MARGQRKPETTTKTPAVAPAKGTGLCVTCYSAMFNSAHQDRVEVRVCKNGSYHVRCPGCGFTGFIWGEDWRKDAITLEEARRLGNAIKVHAVLGGGAR